MGMVDTALSSAGSAIGNAANNYAGDGLLRAMQRASGMGPRGPARGGLGAGHVARDPLKDPLIRSLALADRRGQQPPKTSGSTFLTGGRY